MNLSQETCRKSIHEDPRGWGGVYEAALFFTVLIKHLFPFGKKMLFLLVKFEKERLGG